MSSALATPFSARPNTSNYQHPLHQLSPAAHIQNTPRMSAYPSGAPPQQQDDRPHTGYSYRASSSHGAPPPGSAHGYPQPPPPDQSPERLHSSQGYPPKGPQPPQSPYHEAQLPPGSSGGYPPPPITPISGSAYPPQPPSSAGYYGLTSTPGGTDQPQVPSPPATSNGRPPSQNFTTDGIPIVPVGVSGGKMFRCRGYGDCDKVFTRSEHLARHVRSKHTGERPFPCHCGKAFSRLDNLRQHAATVHADQTQLNEAMLNSLAPVHAALSQRANRDQRKRGEVVDVPKNAIERPRHNEGYRHKGSPGSQQGMGGSPYAQYHDPQQQWNAPPLRPGTREGYYPPMGGEGYPPAPPLQGDDAGPSRRPASAGYAYPQVYYGDQRPPTAPGTSSSSDSMSQLPYPYRPMSSQGRELPVPVHYAESEPPTSAHGPPQSPMYPPGVHPPQQQQQWSSPPSQHHASYPPPPPPPHEQAYPPQATPDGYAYPHPASSEHPPPPAGYGAPPPGSAGSNYASYPPQQQSPYYPHATPSQQYAAVGPPTGTPGAPAPYPPYAPESPFNYSAPPSAAAGGEYAYAPAGYDSRKRRAEGSSPDEAMRKQPRPSSSAAAHLPQNLGEAMRQGQPPQPQPAPGADPMWLPPASERRSSLAISALLGSPQQAPRSRPQTADIHSQGQAQGQGYQPYGYGQGQAGPDDGTATGGSSSVPATPVNGTPARATRGGEGGGQGETMEMKAKALLGSQS